MEINLDIENNKQQENNNYNENNENNNNNEIINNNNNRTINYFNHFNHFKSFILLSLNKYTFQLKQQYNILQTNILSFECLSNEPNLFNCIEALENGADPNAIIGDGLMRPIHAIAKKANVLLIQCLILAGADINAQNGRNQTALLIASDSIRTDSGYIAVIKYLSHRKNSKINLRDVGGNTALLNGIYRNNVWITRYLL